MEMQLVGPASFKYFGGISIPLSLPQLLPPRPQSWSSLFSTVDRMWKKYTSLAAFCTAGKLGTRSYTVTFPHGRNHGPRRFLSELCCLGGRVVQVKLNCFSNLLQCIQAHIFLPQWCARTSLLQNWTFTKAFPSGWTSKMVFSRSFQTTAKWSWSRCVGYCEVYGQNWSLYTYYPVHMWARHLNPLVYGAETHSSHESTFVHGWMSTCCCWVGIQRKESYSAMMLS